jgi:type VII secretion protein EccE
VGTAAGAAIGTARPMVAVRPEVDLRTRPMLRHRGLDGVAPVTPSVQPPHQSPVTDPLAAASKRRAVASTQVREYVEQINLLQVICWQAAAIAVLLTVRQPWPVLTVTSVSAAALIALTTIRVGGRWLYELATLAVAYLIRVRRRDLPDGGAKTLALLGMLLPGSTIKNVETTYGTAMAISHPGGLTATLRPESLTPELLSGLPMPAALLPSNDGQHQSFGVQAVFHTGVRADKPRRLWVAVHAARTVEVAGDDELTLALRNAVRRVRRALARAGVPAEPLADEPALAAIAGLAHITGGRNEVREDWHFWRTGAVCQAAFRLTGWDRLGEAHARMLINNLLAGVPGVAVTITVNARSDRDGPRVDAVLRLAATTEAAVEAAADAMTDRLAPAGVRLARLDGTHQSGVAASLPIGVFLT